MGSSRARKSELLPSRERLHSHEELEMFMQMRKGEREQMNSNADEMPNGDIAFHAHNYELLSGFDAGPIEAGSALEAHVAARLSSSSIYRSSKPILRYASKRNNTDLLDYGAGKTDFDWLMTPPDTPPGNSFEDAPNGAAEGNIVHMLSTASQEFGDKFLSPEAVASILLDSGNVVQASTSNVTTTAGDSREVWSEENHVVNDTKPNISSNMARNTTKATQNGLMSNQTKGSIKASSKPGDVALHGTSSGNGTKNRTNGLHQNPVVASSTKATRTATLTSRFSAPPTIKTNVNMTSSSLQNTKTGGSTTPKSAITRATKQTTITNPSKRPTTPTPRQNQPESTANSSKPRSTSIGRGAVHASSNTAKQSKGSRSTSSSRVGSPETKPDGLSLPWESLDMPSAAPPNLRTTIPKRSASTTRGSRQPTTPTNGNNTGNNTSRSVSASRGRSTSTSRPSISSGTGVVAPSSSKGNNNKGASNGSVLGSKMVDKVVQCRQAAVSLSSSSLLVSPSSKSSTLSTQSSASSLFSVTTPRSASSSMTLVSSPSSVQSMPSISTVSSSSPGLEFSNKSMIKSAFSNASTCTKDSSLDFTYGRSNQMSTAKPVRGSREIQQLETRRLQEDYQYNENSKSTTLAPLKNIQALKNFNTMAAALMEKQKQEELSHQKLNENTGEESSDFSTELEAIMRQDRGHNYYGAFPSRDILKVNNNWMMNSPDSRNDSMEFMHLFRQGIDKYGVSESPLVCQHGDLGNCDKCNSLSGRGSRSFGEGWKPSPLSSNISAIFKNQHDVWKGTPY